MDFKNYLIFPLLFIITLLTFGCEKYPSDTTRDNKTVLIYMAANNNLSPYAEDDLKSQFETIAPDFFYEGRSGDALFVYIHQENSSPRLVRVYNKSGVILEETIEEFDYTNSCNSEVLKEVVQCVFNRFPAKEQGIVFWSHGYGWLPEGYFSHPTPTTSVKSFGKDDSGKTLAEKELSLQEINEALPFKLSYIIFDACFMGGIEVAYELKDKCDYLVVSPTEILAEGYPYSEVTNILFKEGNADLQAVARCFYNHYKDKSSSNYATISLIKTAELPSLAETTKAILDNGGREKISSINMGAMQPYFRQNKHWFYDFRTFISAISTNATLYKNFEKALENVVIYKATTDYFIELAIDPEKYSGLSCYIPRPTNSYLDSYYKTLLWNKDVGIIK